jgi:transcriptional regulator with GAF, ATPase, and Fis domain
MSSEDDRGPSTEVGHRTRPQGEGRDRQQLVKRFRLSVIDGPDAGASWQSSGTRAVVGSDATADLVLHDLTVSRFHCEIEIVAGRAHCRDCGSLNGTRVDGVSIIEAHLANRAVLTVGDTRVRVDVGPDHVVVPMSERARFGLLVGQSPAMRTLFAALERAAETDATVLMLGETGTGKGVTAESLHEESARRGGPFVMVQCGALPRDLLESELFGHRRGAFTGATADREGAFAAAAGGTLFLDEIGELGPELQPKLLHAIERREIKPLGSNDYQSVDVRLIAATNRNLRVEVNAGRFRSDLYYRLAVVELTLPPLRDRLEDLPLLVEAILEATRIRAPADRAALQSDDFLHELARHSWPGNIRELRNHLERCLALRRADPPESPETAPAVAATGGLVDATLPMREARERWQGACERSYLEEILRRNDGNVTAAARAAGVDRSNFYRLLWRHGLR